MWNVWDRYLVLAFQNLRPIDVNLVVISIFMAVTFLLIVQGRLAFLAGLKLTDSVEVLRETVDLVLMFRQSAVGLLELLLGVLKGSQQVDLLPFHLIEKVETQKTVKSLLIMLHVCDAFPDISDNIW